MEKLFLKTTDEVNPGCGYIITCGKGKIFLKSIDELRNYYDENFAQNKKEKFTSGKNILQPYLVSRTKCGLPFDFRIHATRASEGKFKIFSYARVNSSNKSIASNIGQGGGYARSGYDFLRDEFGEDYKTLYSKIMNLGRTLPDYVQSFFKKTIFAIGIDIGIQRIGDSYVFKIFEINITGPHPVSIETELAFTHLEYIQYLGKQLAEGTLEDNVWF